MTTERLKTYVFLLIIVVLFGFIIFQQCEAKKQAAAQVVKLDQTFSALDDKMQKIVNKNGDTSFTEKTVNYSLDDLVKTDYFKQLSKEKQQYYTDLQKTKNLLASTFEMIQKRDSIIANLQYNVGTRSDTGVCFKYGDTLKVPLDTSNKYLHYSGGVAFNKERSRLALEYQYKLKINSDFTRNKDGSINVTHTLDDPNAKVIEGQSYFVPAEKKTKWQKFKGYLVETVKISVPAAVTGFVSYKVGQATAK